MLNVYFKVYKEDLYIWICQYMYVNGYSNFLWFFMHLDWWFEQILSRFISSNFIEGWVVQLIWAKGKGVSGHRFKFGWRSKY